MSKTTKNARKRKGRSRDYEPGTMLHPTKDKPKKHVVRGPAYTPISRRPVRRARVFGTGTELDPAELVQLSLSADATYHLALLHPMERSSFLRDALGVLRLTEIGYARALTPVLCDDDSTVWACRWPFRPLRFGRLPRPPAPAIDWTAP